MSLNYHEKVDQSKAVTERRKKFQTGPFEETLTVQAEKEACCVNNIMARYVKTGQIDHIRLQEGIYADISNVGDFTDAMNIVAVATQDFEQMPAELRKQFNNDPAEFLDFVKNPDNEAKLYEMGLAVRPAEPTIPDPVRVKVVSEDDASTVTT